MMRTNKTSLYGRIALSFLLFSLLIALVIFYLTFSWATITITPRSETLHTNVTIDTSEIPSGQSIKSVYKEQDMNGEGSFSVESSIHTAQHVSGTVTLVNSTANAQPLRPTTRLLSANNILFRLKGYAMIPAKGQVNVEVVADQTGDIGTIDGSTFSIPGLWEGLRTQIYGKGFAPLQNGDQELKVVMKSDISKAISTLTDSLTDKFKLSLNETQAATPFKNPFTVSKCTQLKATPSVQEGSHADQFSLSLSLRCTAVTVESDDITQSIQKQMQEKVAVTQEVVLPALQDMQLSIKGTRPTQHTATLTASCDAQKITKQDDRIFNKEKLAGLDQEGIKAYFSTYDDIQDVSVRLYPFWVTRAPLLLDHIHILIKK